LTVQPRGYAELLTQRAQTRLKTGFDGSFEHLVTDAFEHLRPGGLLASKQFREIVRNAAYSLVHSVQKDLSWLLRFLLHVEEKRSKTALQRADFDRLPRQYFQPFILQLAELDHDSELVRRAAHEGLGRGLLLIDLRKPVAAGIDGLENFGSDGLLVLQLVFESRSGNLLRRHLVMSHLRVLHFEFSAAQGLRPLDLRGR